MRQLLLSLCLFFLFQTFLPAQSGCPGCLLSLPPNLPDDTLYLPPFPDGEKGTYYDEDISFRVPKSTTPVHAIDSTTPAGLPISKIKILSIEGLPPGLFWEASQTVFETNTETDGCIKICGIPALTDSFVLTVHLRATVLFLEQETSFPVRLYIAPKVSVTDGFTMSNINGCDSTTVTFTNNIPSNGVPGYTYEWDFGDGTTYTGENPPPHTYDNPGTYEVNYHATIDTSGYVLQSVTVLSVPCTDLFGADPDLYVFITDQSGNFLLNPTMYVNNTPLPYTFTINFPMEESTIYYVNVWDEDAGLNGTDDPCGSVGVNTTMSSDTLTGLDGFSIVVNIVHPVDEIFSTDTVKVYPKPITPIITANKLTACEGSNNIVLESSFGDGNHWLVNSELIPDETDFLFMPDSTGYYQVQVQNTFGCSSTSDSVFVEFYGLPEPPTYINDRNNLKLEDTLALPANYALQWYLFASPIPGATGFTHCALVNGDYSLVVTDLDTGCTSSYSTTVTIDPNFDCTIGTENIVLGALRIFPNPASEQVTVEFEQPLSENGMLRVWDVAGRLVQQLNVGSGSAQLQIETFGLNPGMYFLELLVEGRRFVGQLAVMR